MDNDQWREGGKRGKGNRERDKGREEGGGEIPYPPFCVYDTLKLSCNLNYFLKDVLVPERWKCHYISHLQKRISFIDF